MTAIEWTDETWNPVTGCSKVSPGCAHCYAEAISLRFGRSSKPWMPANAAENVVLHPERLEQPLRWRKPRMVFVNSMSDLFHELVPDEFIDRVFAVMAWAGRHTFQVLTKRPERMREYLMNPGCERRIEDAMCSTCCSSVGRCICGWPGDDCGLDGVYWPLSNVWLGTSIENRRYVSRADALRETPAAVRFISAEPLLGPLVYDSATASTNPSPLNAFGLPGAAAIWSDGHDVPELSLEGIDWLIAGGESGPHHRPLDLDWVRALRDRCQAEGVAFFMKQVGGRTPKAGGRLLDGRTWDEMPKVTA